MPPRKKKLTPEGELLAAVIERCAAYPDIHVIRLDPARRNNRQGDNLGFPDLMIVGSGILFRELKASKYFDLRPAQTVWKYRLQAARQDWAVWTTADLDGGRVDADLAVLAEVAAVDTGTGFDAAAVDAEFARAMARD